MKIIPAIFIIFLCSTVNGYTLNQILHAISQVESEGAVYHNGILLGDNGESRGPFQIHRAYWQDAIDYDKSIGGKYEDCDYYDYSVKVVTAYMHRYGERFIKLKKWEFICRIHNGGPNGYKHKSTLSYWNKVHNVLP